MRCSEQRPDFQDTGHHTDGSLRGRWRSGEGDEWMKRAANGLWAKENGNPFLSTQSTERSGRAGFISPGWRKSVLIHRILAPQLEGLKVKAPKWPKWTRRRRRHRSLNSTWSERRVEPFPDLLDFYHTSIWELAAWDICRVSEFRSVRVEADKAICLKLEASCLWHFTGVAALGWASAHGDRVQIPAKGGSDRKLFFVHL